MLSNKVSLKLFLMGWKAEAIKTAGGIAGTAYGYAVGAPFSGAGAIGENIGGVIGGAYEAYDESRPAKRRRLDDKVSSIKPMSRGSSMNKLSSRAAMKNSGKLKVKHGKKIHVSKSLKKKIEKVSEGMVPYGEMKTIIAGYVGWVATKVATATTGPFFFSGNNTNGVSERKIAGPGAQCGADSRSLWCALSAFSSPVAYIPGTDLNFFIPAKILDAASCLWNGKTPSLDGYKSSTNNLTTYFVGGASAGPNPTYQSSLKIDVVNSYVQFEIKNVSLRDVKITFYEYSPTLKFTQSGPLETLYGAVGSTQDNAGGPAIGQIAYNGPSGLLDYGWVTSAHQKYSSIPGFNYKGKVHEMIIKSEEMCTHSIQGPKGILDCNKLADGNTERFFVDGYKGWSVNCMIAVELLPYYSTSGTDAGGRWFKQDANDGSMDYPIHIQFKEVYKLRCPNIAGFVSTTAAKGSVQMLNLRKTRKIINDFVQNNATQPTYFVGAEENPLLASAGTNVQ